MSITKLADRLVSAVVPTTDASANCGRFRFLFYRCCAAPFQHKAVSEDTCGNQMVGSCLNARPECG
ncbi:MAG TPA: hypothetical protein VGP36_11120 [Mycobacteriales bacterium]|jgi:hypothetical protein|nr:hypothetical protein [Mycobacteriales bacterium]